MVLRPLVTFLFALIMNGLTIFSGLLRLETVVKLQMAKNT